MSALSVSTGKLFDRSGGSADSEWVGTEDIGGIESIRIEGSEIYVEGAAGLRDKDEGGGSDGGGW